MAPSKKGICDFGWKARDFKLKGVDGEIYTLADVRGPKGTLVVFICNHCPYVKASIDRIVAEAKAMREIGIGTIAIMPNDTATTRGMIRQHEGVRREVRFHLSYVIDETQEVARAYDVSALPIFWLQHQRRAAVSRTARHVAHDARGECAPRRFRSNETNSRDRPRPAGANALDGLFDQVEGLRILRRRTVPALICVLKSGRARRPHFSGGPAMGWGTPNTHRARQRQWCFASFAEFSIGPIAFARTAKPSRQQLLCNCRLRLRRGWHI